MQGSQVKRVLLEEMNAPVAPSEVSDTSNCSGINITEEDFHIFWKWLTTTRGSPEVKERAENVNIRRVFITLGMFRSELDIVEFMRTWECEDEHTVTGLELKSALVSLTQPQLEILDRFVQALRRKENAEKEREESIREKEIKKREQLKKAHAKRQAKQDARQSFGKRLLRVYMSKESIEEGVENDVEEDIDKLDLESISKSFRAQYGLDKKKKSLSGRFLSYMTKFSGSFSSSKKILPMRSSSSLLSPSGSVDMHSPSEDYMSRRSDIALVASIDDDENQPPPLHIDDSLVSFASSYMESEFVADSDPSQSRNYQEVS